MYDVMTEAERRRYPGKKDACYYKVKSRYRSLLMCGSVLKQQKNMQPNLVNKSNKNGVQQTKNMERYIDSAVMIAIFGLCLLLSIEVGIAYALGFVI